MRPGPPSHGRGRRPTLSALATSTVPLLLQPRGRSPARTGLLSALSGPSGTSDRFAVAATMRTGFEVGPRVGRQERMYRRRRRWAEASRRSSPPLSLCAGAHDRPRWRATPGGGARAPLPRPGGPNDRRDRSPAGARRGHCEGLLYDPIAEKAREVKARYRGACRGCGAPTSPRGGKGDAYEYRKRCRPGAIARQWTRERVRDAMRAWRARYGAAPSSYNWSRTHARRRGGEALKRLQAGEWPARSTVIDLYGSWAAALADAFSGA